MTNNIGGRVDNYWQNVIIKLCLKRVSRVKRTKLHIGGGASMVSIREVAKLAQVSPATVSRVINGTAKVDDEKKERVLRVISETGFVPNEVARSLFKKSAKIIGLILPSIKNPFFTQMASAIEKTADASGYRLVLCNTGNSPDKELSALQMLTSMNADGIILTTSNEQIHEYIENCKIPVIITDRRLAIDGACYVHSDHYEGGRQAAEHLIDCGCKSIVCIKGPQDISSARARYEGYSKVCNEKNIKLQTVDCDYDFNAGLEVTEKILKKFPDVDGIVACNDIVAISVYKVLHKKGIKVPEDIQLIGFDNISLSELLTPELTTIAQPIEEIGAKAAELIINRDEELTEREFTFETELIIRETTKLKGDR